MKLKVDRLKRNQSGLRSGLLDYTILYLVLPFQRHISRGSIKKKTQKPFVFFDPPSLVLLQKQTTEGGGKAVVVAIATIFFLAFFGFSTFFVPNNVNAMHGYWCVSSQSKSKKTLKSLLVTFSPET